MHFLSATAGGSASALIFLLILVSHCGWMGGGQAPPEPPRPGQ